MKKAKLNSKEQKDADKHKAWYDFVRREIAHRSGRGGVIEIDFTDWTDPQHSLRILNGIYGLAGKLTD